MKFPKLFKRAAAVLMDAVTTLTVLPATTAFAAGDIGTISFTHTYDRNGNAIRYNSSDVFDGYTAGGAGNIIIACMWMAIQRFVFSRESR